MYQEPSTHSEKIAVIFGALTSLLIPIRLTHRMDKSAEATPNLSIPKPKYAVRFITINGRDYLHRLWKSLTTDLELLHFRLGKSFTSQRTSLWI